MVLFLSYTFTQPLIDAFFNNPDLMNLLARTRDAMIIEGIGSPVDLLDFQKENITQIVQGFERPPRAPNVSGNLAIQSPFQFPTKSQKILLTAMKIADYYKQTDREVKPSMMMWRTLKSFTIHMSALEETTAHSEIVPIKSSMPMTKYLEYFKLHLSIIVGFRNCPLDYVIRELLVPTAVGTALLPEDPHSAEHDSIEGKLCACLSFNHPLYRNGNAKLYQELAKVLVEKK